MSRPATGGNGSKRSPSVRTAAQPSSRGRPRSVGALRCDRCKRGDVAKIRVRWPDGSICGICFTEATHTFGTCAECSDDNRMLPGRNADGAPICKECAHIHTKLECMRCEREAERFRGGLCAQCVVRDDLEALLRPGDNLGLHRLVRLLSTVERPESIYTYVRGAKARELLIAIGDRRLALNHDAFDAAPQSTALGHLRALLVHHGLLPSRGPDRLHAFEQWLEAKLSTLPDDGTRAGVERFATWHHVKRVRQRATDARINLETVTHAAKQEITEAAKFLIWLRQAHQVGSGELAQGHIDEYLSDGPSTRKHVRNYVRWLNQEQGRRTERLDAPHRLPQSFPIVTQSQRIDAVRNCLEWNRVDPALRVAGLILLLWAQPLNKIVMLRRDAVRRDADGMTFRFGQNETAVPGAIADLLWKLIERPSNSRTANGASEWLFPSTRAGQHLHPATLSTRLKVLGIDTQRFRNATLQNLVSEVDARTLIDTLGYSPAVITKHAARSGTRMGDYVELKRRSTT